MTPVATWQAPWQDLARRIEGTLGLQFTDPADLQRGLRRAMGDLGLGDEAQSLASVLRRWPSPAIVRTLARHLTVGETYFLRDRAAFDALEKTVLPALLQARREAGRRLRIWCAACCTGEEAYTLAILLHRMLPDIDAWNISLLATDLNEDFLARAREASYGPWSFREAAAWMASPWFERDGRGRYVVAPHIRERVTFARCNLVDDAECGRLPGTVACDLVLCRNVLMYFSAPHIESVVRRLQASLVPGGCLVVGGGEIGCVKSPLLQPEYHPGAVFYRKRAPAGAAALPVPGTAALPAPEPAKPQAPPRISPPGDTEHLERQARALADQGAWDEALACCDRWLAQDKLAAEAHYLKGMVLLESGDKRAALASLRNAVYADGNHAGAYIALGRLEEDLGQPERARHALDTARRLLQREAGARATP